MPISNYPGGFANGVTIRNLPILNTYGGKVYWVDSGAGSNQYKGTFDRPFATLDYAIGRCTANNGDVILVKAGHAETLIADSGVDIDVAGITVFGLGNGEDRPIFTFTTDADADFKIAAANTAIHNLVFKCNIASQAMMIEVTGDDAEIGFCEFREGSATGLNFITIGVADNDADRCHIHDCKFYMPTAGNGDSAINFAKDHAGVKIERCVAYGDFDLACIDIPAGGNAQVDCLIQDCVLTNLLTGQHAIQVNGTGSTGKIINCFLQTDAQATSIDAGGMECYNVLWHIGTDQTDATLALAPIDGNTNFIGADNSNNAAATTNVAANEDGSVLERLEQLQEAVNKGSGSALAANESLVDVLYAANGIGTFPNGAAPANGVSIAEVLRDVWDALRNGTGGTEPGTNKSVIDALGTNGVAAAAGTCASAVSLFGAIGTNEADATTPFDSSNVQANQDGTVLERLEQIQEAVNNGTGTALATNESLVDVLYGGNGIITFPTGAAAANGISMAEVLRYLQENVIRGSGTALPNNQSIYDLLAGTNGIATFPSAAVPANAVSIAEVLRYAVEQQLWRLATKAYTFAGVGGTQGSKGMYTVTGDVEIEIFGVCKDAFTSGGAATIELGVSGNTACLIAQTTATDLIANEIWHDATPTTTVESLDTISARRFVITNGQNVYLTIATADLTAGDVTFYCRWRPLSSDGNVVAA